MDALKLLAVHLRLAPVVYTCSAVIALGGCEPQASNDYPGEPMFALHGRIELPVSADPELVPVLAMVNNTDQSVHLFDTQVAGEFPSNFKLSVVHATASGGDRRQLGAGNARRTALFTRPDRCRQRRSRTDRLPGGRAPRDVDVPARSELLLRVRSVLLPAGALQSLHALRP